MLVLRYSIDAVDERKVGANDGRHDTRADGLAFARTVARADMFCAFWNSKMKRYKGKRVIFILMSRYLKVYNMSQSEKF